MHALESCLKFQGQESNYWWLAGVSGDAFKFIYDRDDVREPMRDLVPIDTVSLACSSMGWEGKWYVDEKIENVVDRVKRSLKKNYPILTSNLGSQWYHGANIITGINEESNEFFLQIGRVDLTKSYGYEKIPIPKKWDGPVPGPIIWADNPIFIFEKRIEKPNEEKTVTNSLKQALDIYNKKTLSYKDHPGAQNYSTPSLKGKVVNQGLNAFIELREEVTNSVITWPIIWRITTQCGQLSYDRSNVTKFLKTIVKKYSQFSSLEKISDLYNETMNNANALKKSYWDDRLRGIDDLEKLLEEMYNSQSFVYNISRLGTDKVNQIRNKFIVMDTLWGPAVILDSPKRRNYSLEMIDIIINNENKCIKELKKSLKGEGKVI